MAQHTMKKRNLFRSFDELILEALSSPSPSPLPPKQDTNIPTSFDITELPISLDLQSSRPTQLPSSLVDPQSSHPTRLPRPLDPQSSHPTQSPTTIDSFSQSILSFENLDKISSEALLDLPNNSIDHNHSSESNNNNNNSDEAEKTIIFVITFLSVFLFVISLISLLKRRRFLLRKANGGKKSYLLFSSIGMKQLASPSSSSSRKKSKVRWYDLHQQPQQEQQLSKQFNEVFEYYDREGNDSISQHVNVANNSGVDDDENVVDVRYPLSNISTLSIDDRATLSNDDRASHIASSNIGGSQHDTLESDSVECDSENKNDDNLDSNDGDNDNDSHSSNASYCSGDISVHRSVNEMV